MSSWPLVKLGNLVDIKHGYAFKGDYFTDIPTGDFVLTPGNFAIGGGFQWNKAKYYSGEVPEDFVLHPGDIIVTMTDLSKNADTLGYSARVPETKDRLLHNQRLGKVEVKSDTILPSFVHWLLRTAEYRTEILASYTGSTVKHTSPKKIKSYQFRLPSVEEQSSICDVLDTIERKIQLNSETNETLEAMARAIFKDWFVDFGPVRAKMEGREPYLSREIWDLFPDRLDEEGKPTGWGISKIGEEVNVVGGSTPSTKRPEFWDGDIAWATPKDLAGLNAPVLIETTKTISKAGLSQISSRLLPRGTVLLSSRAPVGYIAISDIPIAVNQGFIAMRCEKRLPNTFVWLWTKENIEVIKRNANGSTFEEISKKNFRPIPVVIPHEGALRTFDEFVRPLINRIMTIEQEKRTLAKTRDLLLPKLISGQLTVHDTEGAVEEAV